MEKLILSGIYEIVNIRTNKRYIGSSININKRFVQHRAALRNNRHKNKVLQNSWNKHGENNFQFKILTICDINNLLFYEQQFIDYYNYNDLYNIRIIAETNEGLKATEETRKLISQNHHDVSGKNNPMYGQKRKRHVIMAYTRAHNKPVIMSIDGEDICIFESATYAQYCTGITRDNIGQCLSKKNRLTAGKIKINNEEKRCSWRHY